MVKGVISAEGDDDDVPRHISISAFLNLEYLPLYYFRGFYIGILLNLEYLPLYYFRGFSTKHFSRLVSEYKNYYGHKIKRGLRGNKVEGVCVMKDKELKIEKVDVSPTLGGAGEGRVSMGKGSRKGVYNTMLTDTRNRRISIAENSGRRSGVELRKPM